jgi:hypothetical protein
MTQQMFVAVVVGLVLGASAFAIASPPQARLLVTCRDAPPGRDYMHQRRGR